MLLEENIAAPVITLPGFLYSHEHLHFKQTNKPASVTTIQALGSSWQFVQVSGVCRGHMCPRGGAEMMSRGQKLLQGGTRAPPSPVHGTSASSGLHPGLSCWSSHLDVGLGPSAVTVLGHTSVQGPPRNGSTCTGGSKHPHSLPGGAGGAVPWTLQRQQTWFMLREGLSAHPWDRTALGSASLEQSQSRHVHQTTFSLTCRGLDQDLQPVAQGPSHTSDTRGMLRWKTLKKMQETNHDGAFPTKGPILMQAGAAFSPSPT